LLVIPEVKLLVSTYLFNRSGCPLELEIFDGPPPPVAGVGAGGSVALSCSQGHTDSFNCAGGGGTGSAGSSQGQTALLAATTRAVDDDVDSVVSRAVVFVFGVSLRGNTYAYKQALWWFPNNSVSIHLDGG